MTKQKRVITLITPSLFGGTVLGILTGYFLGNIGVGLFFFVNIGFLHGIGLFCNSRKNKRSGVLFIGRKPILIHRPKTWNMWLYPIVIVDWIIVIIFALYLMGGDPAKWPVYLLK